MKRSCLACKKVVRVHEGVLISHQPPARLKWLATAEKECVGSGMKMGDDYSLDKMVQYGADYAVSLKDELEEYRSASDFLMVEVKYLASEDPDKPTGKIWERHSVDNLIEKSIGAGVTNYFIAAKHDDSNLVKIGSESSLLAGGRDRAIEQKKRDYIRHLEKEIVKVDGFFN